MLHFISLTNFAVFALAREHIHIKKHLTSLLPAGKLEVRGGAGRDISGAF